MSFSVLIDLPNKQVGALLASILVDEARDYIANFNPEYTAVTLSSETKENINQSEHVVRAFIQQIIHDIRRQQAFLPRLYAPLFHMPLGEEAVKSVEGLYQVNITFTNNDLSIESLSRAILQASQQGLVCARHLRNVSVSVLSNGEDATPSTSTQPGPATWCCNGIRLPPGESQVLEDLLQFGGQQVRLLGNYCTVDFREMKAIGLSGEMPLQRSPPITNLPEQHILLNVVGLEISIANAISNLRNKLDRYCNDFLTVSLSPTGAQPLSAQPLSRLQQQVTNFCWQYCIDFSFRTDGTQQLLSINGPCEYLDKVHVLIRDFVHNLPQAPPPQDNLRLGLLTLSSPRAVVLPAPAIVRQSPSALTSTPIPRVSFAPPAVSQAPVLYVRQTSFPPSATSPVPPLWTPQLQDCVFNPVVRLSQEWNEVVSHVRATLTTAEVTKVERIQNRPLWERYRLEGRQMSSRNNGETNEKYLFHGTRDTNPHQVVQSESGIDFRYSRDNRLMWGNGAYFAENASYSNSYSYKLDKEKRQMLIVSVLTGISCPYGQRKDSNLTRPPERMPNRLYDTVYGESAGSGIYVVYDHFKSCPAYLVTYINRA